MNFHFCSMNFAFVINVYILLCSLEMLDKLEPPTIPDGYGISVAYYCLLDITRSIQFVIMGSQPLSDGKKIRSTIVNLLKSQVYSINF